MSETYRFQVVMAGIPFAVTVRNLQTKIYCRDYITEGASAPAFELFMEEEDIIQEWRSMLESGRYTKEFVNHLPGYYFEIFAMHKKAAAMLFPRGIMVFHGAAVSLDGQACLFGGAAGEGKSTHAKAWTRYFGEERCRIINDDKPFLEIREDAVTVWGSPWAGKHQRQQNIHAPLQGICILQRDIVNHIDRCTPEEAFALCRMHLFATGDAGIDAKQEEQCRELMHRIPVYRAGCDISPDAVKTVWQGLCTR